MYVLLALGLIAVGLACLFGRDFLWDLTASGYRSEGLASERSPEWDMRTMFGGVGAIVIGVVVLLIEIFG